MRGLFKFLTIAIAVAATVIIVWLSVLAGLDALAP